MKTDLTWTTEKLVAMLNTIAAEGFGSRITIYGTHTGDPFAYPWTGPIAWEIHVNRASGNSEDWGLPVSELTRLNVALESFGVEAVLSSYNAEVGSLMLRLRDTQQSRFLVPRP